MDRPEQYDPEQYAFIPAFVTDNPIYANDDNYLATLNALPSHLRDAFLKGDWNVFAGAYFDIFDLTKHVRQAPSFDPWTSRWISIDWGFAHNSAVYWHATKSEGNHVTYREFVQNNLTPKMLATAIVEQTRGEKIANVYLSPDAFARRTNFDTVASQLDEEFKRVGLPPVESADNDRVGGWMLMYSLLQAEQWTIDPSCARLIEGIQGATRDAPDHLEDILKVDGDDSIDSARYGIKSRLSLAPIPRRVLIEQAAAKALEQTSDMSLTMLYKRKAEQEIKSSAPVPVRRVHPMMRRWQRGVN